MIYNVIKPFFKRSVSNMGNHAKTYVQYLYDDENGYDGIVFTRLILLKEFDVGIHKHYTLEKRYKDKFLMKIVFTVKPDTFSELMNELMNRIKEQENN